MDEPDATVVLPILSAMTTFGHPIIKRGACYVQLTYNVPYTPPTARNGAL